MGPDETEARAPLPLRATFIVLSLWVFGMVILALVVVPAVFASCFPAPAPAP